MKTAKEVWNEGLNPVTMFRVGNGLSVKTRKQFQEKRKQNQFKQK